MSNNLLCNVQCSSDCKNTVSDGNEQSTLLLVTGIVTLQLAHQSCVSPVLLSALITIWNRSLPLSRRFLGARISKNDKWNSNGQTKRWKQSWWWFDWGAIFWDPDAVLTTSCYHFYDKNQTYAWKAMCIMLRGLMRWLILLSEVFIH